MSSFGSRARSFIATWKGERSKRAVLLGKGHDDLRLALVAQQAPPPEDGDDERRADVALDGADAGDHALETRLHDLHPEPGRSAVDHGHPAGLFLVHGDENLLDTV